MQYAEMTYKEKQAFEKSLTVGQRGKIRRLEKQFAEQIQPMNWASHAREEEVRKEAWVTLRIEERVNELEESNRPRIHELQSKIEELGKELANIQENVSEERSKIRAESYSMAYDDPQVQAMNAIIKKTREQQRNKLQSLIDSFTA